MTGKIKPPIIAPINPPAIDRNADEFLPPYIFIVNAENKYSSNSKRTQTSNAIIKIFLDIISKLLYKPKKKLKNKKMNVPGRLNHTNIKVITATEMIKPTNIKFI